MIRVSFMKMKNMAFPFVIILLLAACSVQKAEDKVKDGSYISRDLSKTGTEKLNGDWEFYWHELLSPDDFKDGNYQSPLWVKVPNPWSDYELKGERLPKQGYATYRMHLEFLESEIGTAKALYLPPASSAYKLWIAGEPKAENGVVGKSEESMKPQNVPKMVQFHVHEQEIELVMQVSNYYQRKAGIFDSIIIGEPEAIAQYRERKLLFRSMIVMSLVVMVLYHVALFALRRSEWSLIFSRWSVCWCQLEQHVSMAF